MDGRVLGAGWATLYRIAIKLPVMPPGTAYGSSRPKEVFLDQLARYEDASPQKEARQACIGLTTDYRLLYVVHVVREGDVLRLISARLGEPVERRRYEND